MDLDGRALAGAGAAAGVGQDDVATTPRARAWRPRDRSLGPASLVYEKVGLSILRRAWVNLDLIWAVAIVAAGGFTLFT
jgi:hypothetical protein